MISPMTVLVGFLSSGDSPAVLDLKQERTSSEDFPMISFIPLVHYSSSFV